MAKQAIVIGLGHFGMSVARALAERGAEVLAVDSAEDRVRVAAGFVAEAACFDATDTDALARSSPERRDVCICAIGDESREASIICTALLRQTGARRVIARANDELHARILYLVGAHQVVNPEREFGERFARQIMYESVLGEMPLGESLRIAEIRPPAAYVGKTLAELRLPAKHGVTVVAVRRAGTNDVTMPGPTSQIGNDDVLVVVSDEKGIDGLLEGS
jgi:trk system potassium uptake protein TrkA